MSDKKRKQKKTQINIKDDKKPQESPNRENSIDSNNNSSNQNSSSEKNTSTTNTDSTSTEASAAQLEFQIDDNANDSGGNKVLGIIAIILGILVIFAGFTAYKYFTDAGNTQLASNEDSNIASSDVTSETNQNQDNSSNNGNSETPSIPFFDMDSEGISQITYQEEETDYYGFANGGDVIGTSTTSDSDEGEGYTEASEGTTITVGQNEQAEIDSGIITTSDENNSSTSSVLSSTTTSDSTEWVANNYNHGDIQTGNYKVVQGDTLWELAEGAYGDGTQWHTIAEANNVSYLSNGNPLITTGSTILIP